MEQRESTESVHQDFRLTLRVAAPAKRVKVDIDLTASETTTARGETNQAGAVAAKKKTVIASIFQPPASSKGRWLPDIRRKSTGKIGGAGHFVWDDPQPSTKIAAFGEQLVFLLRQGKRGANPPKHRRSQTLTGR